MGKGTKVILGLVIVAIVVVGAIVVMRDNNNTNNQNGTGSQSSQTPNTSTDSTAAATVTYKDSGFEPTLSTIKAGQTIKLVNSSNSELQIASNPHPTHTDNTELNVGVIAKGDSRSVTLNSKGSWGFHNHLNPSNQARVDVQ